MRILPVQNYYRTNNTYLNKNRNNVANPTTVQKQAVQNMTIPPQTKFATPINFTGIKTTALNLAKQIPVEDRLASIFQVAQHGDVILLGDNIKSAQKALKSTIKDFKTLIKRFIFIPEDGMKDTVVFTRNAKDELEVFNPNKANIFLGDTLGKKDAIKTGESFYVLEGDRLFIGTKTLDIKTKPKTDLSLHRKIFSEMFDRTEDVKPVIERQNLKSIMTLARQEAPRSQTLTFADVGGQDAAIRDLKKGILYPVKYPEAYKNSVVNHGFIMYGPPGTGKTLIAQALANETNANFVKLNGLEMESKWVGQSEENWRTLFDEARENQPSVIFIDEFDAVAKKRNGQDVYGDKVVNQILTLMSDVEKNGDEIYVIAATNKPDALDEAIKRSGRFGKHIEVKAPDTLDGVSKILDIHTKNKPLATDVDKKELSQKLLGLKTTGADIAHITNTAHENAFERAGIYEKMEAGTFTKEDIDNLTITADDFKKAIAVFAQNSTATKSRRPIGFNRPQ